MLRKCIIAPLLACSLALGGCASVASALSSIAVATSSSTPTQATTVAEATQAVTLAEQALDVYVKTGNPSQAVLQQLNILVPALHNTLVAAETANKAGNSAATAAAMAAFNQALAAYNSYLSLEGISH